MKFVLGCMEMGRRLSKNDSQVMLENFLKSHKEVDTAYMYCDGESEKILGQNLDLIKKYDGLVASKINPVDDGFVPENLNARFRTTLERLQVPSLDLLYLHFPCHINSLELTLDSVNKLHEEGLFKRFGVSNYSSWEVYKIHKYCEKMGYIKPSVYQGMYNCITRDVEKELFPCLRDLGISFYAYNPLAGGLLTGKYKYADAESFNDSTYCRFHGVGGEKNFKMYRDRYWNKNYFDTVEDLINYIPNRSLLQVSFDWIINHSKLTSQHGDAIIIGASTLDQYNTNMSAIAHTSPLPEGYLKIMDLSYAKISGCCPSYFR